MSSINKEKSTKKNNIIFFCIACIIISTIFTFNISNSRYMAEVSAEDDALAIPILTLSNNGLSHTIDNMLPGETREITFSVSNKDDSKINEILLEYYFKIEMESEIPLEVKIYDISSGTEVDVTDKNSSDPIEMKASEEETKNYKLKVIWDASYNDASYAGKEINCNVTLEALQVVDAN